MIQFDKIYIEDFMSIGEVVFDFSKGVRLLLGRNLDSVAADDNGAGKSTIAEALRWGLYGETCRSVIDKSLTVEHVVRNGAKQACVAVEFTVDGVTYVVKRTRTKTTGRLEITIGEDTYTGKSAQDFLDAVLGINVIQFANLVHLDGAYPKLFAPTTDRDRKDILADLVELALVEQMQERAASRCKEVDNRLSTIEKELTTLSFTLQQAQDDLTRYGERDKKHFALLQEAEAAVVKYTAFISKLKRNKGELSRQMDETQDVETEIIDALRDKASGLERDISLLEHDLDDARDDFLVIELATCADRINSLEINKKVIEQRINEIEDLQARGKCPTCGQDTDEVGTTEVKSLTSQAKGLEDEITELEGSRQSYESKRRKKLSALKSDLEAKRTEWQACRARIATLVGENEEARNALRDKIRQIDEKLLEASKRLAAAENAKTTHSQEIKDARRQRLIAKTKFTEATEAADELAIEQHKLTQSQADLEFWKKGFGPRGVPSLFIETVLPSISSRIQKYANILTGGDVLVELKAYRETKSKTVQEAIQISAVNSKGAPVYGSNSTGERNRINLAVTLGLIDYFRDMNVFSSNLLICDEIFDGLDSTGVEQALLALQESHIPSVLVVSHHDHFKPLFDHTVYVKKENGVSSLEE